MSMFALTAPLTQRGCRTRWGILGLCATPLLGAYLYSHGYTVPCLQCPIRALTGIPCPTCGMTRSFTAIAQGDWSLAITHHLFGPVLFLILGAIAIHLLVELLTKRRLQSIFTSLLKRRFFLWLAGTAYFSYYGYRLLYWSQSGGPAPGSLSF